MAKRLADVPYGTPMTDKRGLPTPSWSNWFRSLYVRVGEGTALSNIELAGQGDTSQLSADVLALQDAVEALQSEQGLNAGPVL